MESLVIQLVNQQKKAAPFELNKIVEQVATAPFAADLLEVDEPLWGSFWHFDVISPGYRLPAVELALLRAIRLDGHWPERTGVEQFLADLRRAVRDPQAGIWTLFVAGEPCVVFASDSSRRSAAYPAEGVEWVGGQSLATVIWYCATTGQLHAGYRTKLGRLNFAGVVEQRAMGVAGQQPFQESVDPPAWLRSVVEQIEVNQEHSLAERLDAEILRVRLSQ